MIPALAWPAVKGFLGKLPWGKIIIYGAVIGALAFAGWRVYSFIKTANENAAAVVKLEADNSALTDANKALQASYDLQLQVLQSNIAQAAEREKEYASAIEQIQAQPDSGCARSSPAIRSSLRLLRNKASR